MENVVEEALHPAENLLKDVTNKTIKSEDFKERQQEAINQHAAHFRGARADFIEFCVPQQPAGGVVVVIGYVSGKQYPSSRSPAS